jgi:diaminopimelate decarboxylase
MPKIADFPYNNAQILELAKQFPTPFHLYHEETIRNTVRGLNKACSWCPGYKNHFAVKATPNPHIMQILKEEGRRVGQTEQMTWRHAVPTDVIGTYGEL